MDDVPQTSPLVLEVCFPFGHPDLPADADLPNDVADVDTHAYAKALIAEVRTLEGDIAARPILAIHLDGGVDYVDTPDVDELLAAIREVLSVADDAPVSRRHAPASFHALQAAGAGKLAMGAGACNRYDGVSFRNNPDIDHYLAYSDRYEYIIQYPKRLSAGEIALDALMNGLFSCVPVAEPDYATMQGSDAATVRSWVIDEVCGGRVARVTLADGAHGLQITESGIAFHLHR